MKAFFVLSLSVVGLSCTLILGTEARAGGMASRNASSSLAEDDEGIDHSNPDSEINVNDRDAGADGDGSTGAIHQSNNENESDSSSSAPSPTANISNGSSNISSGSSSTNQHGSNDHTTYYYSNSQNQNSNSQRTSAKYDDEQTYLDLFGERAKELFTQHIIPSTDAECRWDWRMGRCEPYCSCGFQFLWGDYHMGRSCRFRTAPPPSDEGDASSANGSSEEERNWQEAWQEVWHTQMTEGAVDDVSEFVPPLFLPKSQPNVVTGTSSWDRASATCALPPESRYIQAIRQLTRAFTQSTVVVDNFHKLKNATSNAVNTTVVQSQHHWKTSRRKACETVKRKVEERAQIRNQPVLLTKHGAVWIRRVCGTGDDSVKSTSSDQIIDSNDEAEEDLDGTDDPQEESTSSDQIIDSNDGAEEDLDGTDGAQEDST